MSRAALVLTVAATGLGLLGVFPHASPARELNVELVMTVGHECRLTVRSKETGSAQTAVTRFQADVLDGNGRYIRGVEEGGVDGADLSGTYSMEDEVVRTEDGIFRVATPDDSTRDRLSLTKTFSLSPRGHCTFLHAVVRSPGATAVIRHYTWGYPFGGVRERGPDDPPAPKAQPRRGDL